MMRAAATGVLAAVALATAMVSAGPTPRRARMVLVAFTGMEDAQRLAAPFKHAQIMAKGGKLGGVSIVVYGRAVTAVSSQAKGVPEALRASVAAAIQAGVHVYVCESALDANGLSRQSLLPGVEPVPQGAAKIAELVADGDVPMQY